MYLDLYKEYKWTKADVDSTDVAHVLDLYIVRDKLQHPVTYIDEVL